MKRETFFRLLQINLWLRLNMVEIIVYAGCLLVALGRFSVPSHGPSWPGTYEALTHLWCGVLLGAYFASRDRRLVYALLIITGVELLAFGLFVVTGQRWTVN